MKTQVKTQDLGRRARKARAGFSLAELMVVIVIIGLLATAVAPRLLERLTDAKWGKVKGDLHSINQAITQYAIANSGSHPDTLEDLVTPDENGKRFLDMTKVPKDPWGNEYGYEPPVGTQDCIVTCFGKDGQPGGEGDDRDYTNIMLKDGEK